MLSHKKRGWRGCSGVQHSTDHEKSGGRGQRKSHFRGKPIPGPSMMPREPKGDLLSAPRDYAQFQRIWRRRCHNDDQRLNCMRLIGPGNLPDLFRAEMEPHVLAQMLWIICSESRPDVEGSNDRVVSSSLFAPRDRTSACRPSSTEGSESCADQETSSNQVATCCLEWLDGLSRTSRFELNVKFLGQLEKSEVARVFGLISAAFAKNGDQKVSEVSRVQNAYEL